MESESQAAISRDIPLARNGNYLLLWLGQFVSQMGDKLAVVAFPWLIYRTTGSVVGTGIMFALSTLPYLLFGAVAGVAIDRFNKRTLMIGADLVRAGLLALVPLVAAWSSIGVFILSFLVASAAVVFDPARLSMLPEIVTEQRLMRANSLLATGENLTDIVGYASAGLVLAYVSSTTAFRIDALTFLFSAGALLLMRYSEPMRQAAGGRLASVYDDIRHGLAYLRTQRGLLMNTAMVCASAVGIGASYPLSFLLAVRVFEGGTRNFGLFGAATGIGYLAGSLTLAAAGSRIQKGWAITLGLTAMGCCLGSVAFCQTVWQVCISFAVFGLSNAVALIAVDTYLQTVVPLKLRGRVFGVRFTLTQGTYAASVLASGALAAYFDIRTLLMVAGAIVAIPALAGLLMRDIRRAQS